MAQRRKENGCLKTFITGCIMLAGLAAIAVLIIWGPGQKAGNHIVETIQEKMAPIPFQEVTIEESALRNKYYYCKLDENEQTVYKEIVQGLKQNEAEIYLHTTDAEQANQLFQYVLNDFPEIFWCDGTASTTSYTSQSGTKDYALLKVNYSYSAKEKESRKLQIEETVNQWLDGLGPDASDYDKVKYVFEKIIGEVEYDTSAKDNQNICSVFIQKRSVCAGYTRATQYLLERLGVFATYVTGKTSVDGAPPSPHAWTLVQCDGEYYYVDTTWGDPVFTRTETKGSELEENTINYDYLCCTDDELFKTHELAKTVSFPACTSTKYNYYKMHKMYYDSCDEQVFLKAMNQVIEQKENPVVFKFTGDEVYFKSKELIINDLIKRSAKHLMEFYGLDEVHYSYQEDDTLNKLTIYWNYK